MQSDIVQRLQPILRRNGWGNVKEYSRHIPFMLEREGLCIVETSEITRLTEALRLQMEAKHKEAAEAKLWFSKAQEWKEALRAAEGREKALVRLVERAQLNTGEQYISWHEDARAALKDYPRD